MVMLDEIKNNIGANRFSLVFHIYLCKPINYSSRKYLRDEAKIDNLILKAMRNFTMNHFSRITCCSGNLMKGLFLLLATVLFTITQGYSQESEGSNAVKTVQSSEMNGDYTPAPSMYRNFDALRNSNLAKNGDGELPETAPNPLFDPTANCDDLSVVLVLDESGSMNGLPEQEARESALVLAESFQGTSANLRILEFSAQARFIELDEFFVTETYLDNFEAYLNGGYTSIGGEFQEYASMPGGTPPCAPGYTNWDDAFQTIAEDASDANLVLFLTDGNPTAYNGGVDEPQCGYTVSVSPNAVEAEVIMESLAAAINSSNVLKTDPLNPTKIFPIGVGNGVNEGNLALISGPSLFTGDIFNQDYAEGDIEDIQTNLTAGINTICGTVLSIEKTADITEVCNGDQIITFTISVSNIGFDNDVDRDAENVVITDVFPDGFDIIEETLPAGAVLDGQTVTYDVGTLGFTPESSTVEIQIQATVSEINVLTNTAFADANNANEVSSSVEIERADILTDVLEITSCGPYPWEEGNQIIEESVSGEVVQITRNGCTVNVTLEVTIDEEQAPIVRNEVACGSYVWIEEGVQFGDEPITVSSPEGEPYTLTVPGANGECDQVYNLNLTILEAPNTDIVENFCEAPVDMSQGFPQVGYFPDPGVEGVIWDFPSGGSGFLESGVYIGTLDVEDGCNETFTLYLTISDNEVGAPCPLVGDEPDNLTGETNSDCECVPSDDEIPGCTDALACNYNEDATEDNDSCIYADEACESCSGETDGTGTVVLSDEDGDDVCDAVDVCPGGDDNLDADLDGTPDFCDECPNDPDKIVEGTCGCGEEDLADGTACETEFGPGTIQGCNCVFDSGNETGCQDFKYFLANNAGGGTIIYGIEIIDGEAQMTELKTIDYPVHIAYSTSDDLLYVVRSANGSFRTLDVSVVDGALSAETALIDMSGDPAPLGQAVAVGINNDGKLYIGSQAQDAVFGIDPDGTINPFGTANVAGGDLVFLPSGELILASRQGGKLYKVMPGAGENPELDPNTSISNQVTGLAVTSDGNMLFSANGSNALVGRAADGSDNGVSYPLILENAPFEHDNGDLASACLDAPDLVFDCYPSEVLAFDQGPQTNNQPVALDRSDPLKATGQPDANNEAGGFVSLGVEGSITLGFPGVANDGPGDDIFIYETSFSGDNCSGASDERAVIELSQDGANWVDLGTICRDGSVDIADSGLDYVVAIRITNSASTGSLDGYDVDGVVAVYGCGSIPVEECADPGECYAVSAVYVQGTTTPGNGSISPARSDVNNALEAPEGTDALVFTSLGEGGSLTFEFGGSVPNGEGDDITVIETTFGNPGCDEYPEFADVTVSVDGQTFYYIGTVCKSTNSVDISDAVNSEDDSSEESVLLDCVNYVRVANNDELTTQNGDGFDVDGIIAIHNCDNGAANIASQEKVEAVSSEGSSNTLRSYPNPTDGLSQALFVTGQTEKASLEVYDMNGRLVKGLFSGVAEAGVEYRIDFDGLALPNGVYMYRLTSDSETVIERFMIAR